MFRDVFRQLSHRAEEANKYDFGHVLVIGGSPGMAGAPLLTAMSALRVGAGLVTIASSKSVASALEKRVLEIMVLALGQTEQGTIASDPNGVLEKFITQRKVSVVAIGPGLSRNPETAKFIRDFIAQTDLPIVIDADALQALAWDLSVLKRDSENLVLTPHSGEFAKLTDSTLLTAPAQQKTAAQDFSVKYGVTLVFKKHNTLVVSPDGEIYQNRTGNAGMATAGSGDVLTGVIAGLIAQGINPSKAAQAGVYLHGKAGDLAAKAKTKPGLIARDIIEFLPQAQR